MLSFSHHLLSLCMRFQCDASHCAMLVRKFVQQRVHSISQSEDWRRSSSGIWALWFQHNTLCRSELHSHQRALSIIELGLDLLPGRVLPWDGLEKPVGPVIAIAGTVGTELPLLVGRVCCPTACPQWLKLPTVALLGQTLGLQMAVRGEQLMQVLCSALRRGLAARCSCSCCNDLRAAAAEVSRLGSPVFSPGTCSVSAGEPFLSLCV